MNYIITPRSFRLYENYFSGSRINRLALEVEAKLSVDEQKVFQSMAPLNVFVRAVSIRIQEGWQDFSPFAEFWKVFPEMRQLLGYSVQSDRFPFDVDLLEQFWIRLSAMTFYEDDRYAVDGIQYLQNSIALYGTSEPMPVSRHPFGTNSHVPIGFIDRILDDTGTKIVARK